MSKHTLIYVFHCCAKVITKQGSPFRKTYIFNLAIFAVPPRKSYSNVEDRDKSGRKTLEKFISDRMVKKVKFWDAQKDN